MGPVLGAFWSKAPGGHASGIDTPADCAANRRQIVARDADRA
jgi:hypothetical protein